MIRFTRRRLLPLAFAALCAVMAASSHASAQTYNAGADLLANELPDGPNELLNPNPQNGGVWSYGERSTVLGPSLTLYTAGAHFNNAGGTLDGFAGVPISNGNLPHIYVNKGGPAGFPNGTTGTGELLLHPDGSNAGGFAQEEKAVVRFTAPLSGAYNVQSYWEDVNSCCGGGQAGVDVHVVRNAGVSSSLFSSVVSRENGPAITAHASTVTLNAGDSLDFVVGTNGQLYGDATRTNAIVSTVKDGPIVNVDFNGFNPQDGDAGPGPAFTGNGVLRSDGTINTTSGAGTPSGIWNQVSVNSNSPNLPSMTTGFIDATGAATNLTISLSGFNSTDDCPNCANGPGGNALLRDYLVQVDSTGAATLTIGGLEAGEAYDLFLYTSNGGSTVGGTYSVNGEPAVFATGGDGVLNDYFAMINYVPFMGVEANANGELIVTATGEPGVGLSIINGFQLQLPAAAVPEPTSIIGWAAAGFAVCVYGLRRARRRLAVNSTVSTGNA